MLRDALWQRKLKRLRALAEIDLQIARNERAKKERIQAKVEADMEIRKKRKRIADIKFRLSQIQGETQRLEEELERLDKGKQKEVVATPELPKGKIITAPQKEALEKESFHQNKREDAIWWHKPCCTCLAPIEQRENVEWDIDACSKACKYAYLAVASAKHFTHIPTLIKKYKFSKNCRDLYLDVAYRAERLWVRKYPYEERDYHHTKYHNQLSWMDMAREFAEEVNYFSPNMPPTIEVISTEEAIALRRSFNVYEAQNDVRLMDRFKRMCDL